MDSYQIYVEACEAAQAAVKECVPVPMIVGSPTTFMGSDIDMSQKTYFVEGGVCGFASVQISGRGKFAKFTKERGISYKAYGGGYGIPSHRFAQTGQSLARAEAAAGAAARVFEKYGIVAYVESRMD